MKRAIVVHQWGANPSRDWHPWLKGQLEEKGFEVLVPEMPDTDAPEIDKWVGRLAEVVGKASKDTILIGHSVGCQTILRYLQTLGTGERVNKVVLVAPWLELSSEVMQEPAYGPLAKSWLETPIDWDKVKQHSDSFTCFFSKDDPYVLIANAEIFGKLLGAKIIIEDDMGHYEDDSNVKEVPQVLKEII